MIYQQKAIQKIGSLQARSDQGNIFLSAFIMKKIWDFGTWRLGDFVVKKVEQDQRGNRMRIIRFAPSFFSEPLTVTGERDRLAARVPFSPKRSSAIPGLRYT